MREIKFRAWDDDIKQMLPVVDLSGPRSTHKWLGAKDVVVMQFTGFVDENGLGVYESDIVEWTAYPIHETDSVRVRGVVEWNISAWFIKHYNSRLTVINSFKVIGNIYENPELLEASC